MIGLTIVKQSPLIEEIKSRHPKGIYTVSQFLELVLPNTKFYSVRVLPEIRTISGPSIVNDFKVLDSINKYDGEIEDFKGSYQYKLKEWPPSKHFLNDLLRKPSGCFLELSNALSYKKDLLENLQNFIEIV